MRFDEVSHTVIEEARGGSAQAMETLCLNVQTGAFGLLMSILRDGDDAADALQESLIRLVRFLPKLRETDHFAAWFMRILVNQANSTRAGTPAHIIDFSSIDENFADAAVPVSASGAPPSPRRAAASAEISSIINEAVRRLPGRQKAALILFEMEHLPIRKVAEVMELTDGAVKFHLHEARKNLRKQLAELGISSQELTEEESAV